MQTMTKLRTPRFKTIPYREASPEVKAIYEETMQVLQLPFVLN